MNTARNNNNPAIKILVIEDDVTLSKVISDYLMHQDYDVATVLDGKKAATVFHKTEPHLCIVDVMLPGKNGYEIVQQIRKSAPTVPILFLSALSDTESVLKGFESGGDDYLKKPFSLLELVARIKALTKRKIDVTTTTKSYQFNGYHFDTIGQSLTSPTGQIHQLSHRENELLELLLHFKNDILVRQIALEKIWQKDDYFTARSMDVFITKLRKYFQKDKTVQIINIRGVGYKILVESDD